MNTSTFVMTEPSIHPACDAWPAANPNTYDEMLADIKTYGQRVKITMMPDGSILDGKIRWRICQDLGIEPSTEVYRGDDPIGFVLSKNKHRRHLKNSQLAMVVARLSKLQNGSNQFVKKEGDPNRATLFPMAKTRKQLAQESGLPLSLVGYAKRILKDGDANIVAMVDCGAVTAPVAAQVVSRTSREEQATLTATEVRCRGNTVMQQWPSHQREKPLAPPRLKRIDPPYLKLEVATNEEAEKPPEGSSTAEVLAWREKIGAKVPLYSMKGKDLLECQAIVEQASISLLNLASERCAAADEFFTCIDKMLAHTPNQRSGEHFDFAKEARAALKRIERDLTIVLPKLVKYRDAIKTRKETAVK